MFRFALNCVRKLRKEWLKRRWIPKKYWDITWEEYVIIQEKFIDGLYELMEQPDYDHINSLSQYIKENHDEFCLMMAERHIWESRIGKLVCTF